MNQNSSGRYQFGMRRQKITDTLQSLNGPKRKGKGDVISPYPKRPTRKPRPYKPTPNFVPGRGRKSTGSRGIQY